MYAMEEESMLYIYGRVLHLRCWLDGFMTPSSVQIACVYCMQNRAGSQVRKTGFPIKKRLYHKALLHLQERCSDWATGTLANTDVTRGLRSLLCPKKISLPRTFSGTPSIDWVPSTV